MWVKCGGEGLGGRGRVGCGWSGACRGEGCVGCGWRLGMKKMSQDSLGYSI